MCWVNEFLGFLFKSYAGFSALTVIAVIVTGVAGQPQPELLVISRLGWILAFVGVCIGFFTTYGNGRLRPTR
ncbi:MAG: hypothetical protein Q8Q20_02685 [bacterium]|nr:hypothetical protein [bacterium]